METTQDGASTGQSTGTYRNPPFLTALGLRMLPGGGADGGIARATATLGPATWAEGARRPRLGALVVMADVVAGLRPTGALTPTVDLSVQLVRPLPARGRLDLECRPLREGRRLFVGEVLVHHEGTLVARGVATFINRPYSGPGARQDAIPDGDPPAVPFDRWLRPEYEGDTVLVGYAPEISNGPGGTIQGGLQATVAELAAERALASAGHPYIATGIDIRYLSPVKAGPLAATAEVLAVHPDRAYTSVRLTDAGDGDRLVAYATTVSGPEP